MIDDYPTYDPYYDRPHWNMAIGVCTRHMLPSVPCPACQKENDEWEDPYDNGLGPDEHGEYDIPNEYNDGPVKRMRWVEPGEEFYPTE